MSFPLVLCHSRLSYVIPACPMSFPLVLCHSRAGGNLVNSCNLDPRLHEDDNIVYEDDSAGCSRRKPHSGKSTEIHGQKALCFGCFCQASRGDQTDNRTVFCQMQNAHIFWQIQIFQVNGVSHFNASQIHRNIVGNVMRGHRNL